MSEPLEELPAEQRAWLDRVAETSHQDVLTVVSVLIGVVMYDPAYRRFPPKSLGTDGLTDQERAEDAARYGDTVARDLTEEEIAVLQAALAEGQLPRRQLHPAR
jgi:hypothetical protein